VLLPGVEEVPEELIFLQEFHAVSFQDSIEDEKALFSLEWGITGRKPTRRYGTPQTLSNAPGQNPVGWAPPTTPPVAPPPAPEDDLRSEKGIDYHNLRDLLKAGQWRDADQETYRLMITTVGKEEGQWFDRKDLEEFPCEDLRTLDQLWVKYSNGKFGFSVQKRIWQDCGSPMTSGKEWDDFCVRVGWQDPTASRYVSADELQCNPSFSPAGELPVFVRAVVRGGWVGGFSSLAQRLVNCSTRQF
jgi:hypothetical protein